MHSDRVSPTFITANESMCHNQSVISNPVSHNHDSLNNSGIGKLPDIVNVKYVDKSELSSYIRSPLRSRKELLHRIRVRKHLGMSRNELNESVEQKDTWYKLLDIVGD